MATDGQMSLGSCSNQDTLRQRAQKASEHYQQQQHFTVNERSDNGKLPSSQLSSQDRKIIPQNSDQYNSNHSLPTQYNSESGQGSGAGTISNNIKKCLSGASSNTVVTPTPTSFRRANMRAGILDLRSSYNERQSSSMHVRARTIHGPHTGSRTRTGTSAVENTQLVPAQQQQVIALQQYNHKQQYQTALQKEARNYNTNKTMMCKSNSNMKVDAQELDLPPAAVINTRREYGSTSSLDVLGTSSDNFFSMLSEFQQQYALEQRSPAPPQLRELLQGRLASSSEPHIQTAIESPRIGVRFSNGLASSDKDSGDSIDSFKPNKDTNKHKERTQRAKSITGEVDAIVLKGKPKHKGGKLRSKSIADENGVSLLRKLRGKLDSDLINSKSEHSCVVAEDSPSRWDGCSRRRVFVHFDCQSVGVDLEEVIHQRVHGRLSNSNTTTGASAASGQRSSMALDKDVPDVCEGDGKSNELVQSCPFFLNELGGEDARTVILAKAKDPKHLTASSVTSADYRPEQVRHPACCGVAILDSSPSPSGQILPPLVTHRGHVIEYVDHGAYYYRHFFFTQEHQNFFGMDDNLGPVAISVRREKLSEDARTINVPHTADFGTAQYRLICRTSELRTLRGCVLEEAIPSRLTSSRGIPIKDVLEVAMPQVQLSCLRQAVVGQKTCEQLLKLDEQGISSNYKVGIMYCKSGQATEEDMYNNENSGPALEEFLGLVSEKVRLKGFERYRAGLDCKTDTTGTHSYYTTFNNNQVMFHVSTMLPYTPNNKQQLLRKRHIGNDIVTIVFQEPGALAFSPQTIRSQFQHIFIMVRVSNSNSDMTRYSVAVARSKDVPPFGPKVPENYSFKKSQDFVDFLLAKVINAENAAHKSDKFLKMATRTREEYLKDLASNYVTNTSIDSGSKLSKFGLGSGRKKEKSRKKIILDMFAKGALVWDVQVEDMGTASQVDCLLAIAADTIILVEQSSKDVIFTVPCSTVIGWTPQPSSLRLYFGSGECILFRPLSGASEETQEIITRLQAVTYGTETVKLALKRNVIGQLGFLIQSEGIVTDVEAYGFAWEAGLRKGSRLVEICKVATITLSHDQILDLLRTSAIVKVVAVSPMEDGSPRGNNSLNTKPPATPHIGKAAPSSEHHHLHQQKQHLQPQASPGIKSSSGLSTGVSHSYTDSTVSSGPSYVDGRSSYFGYSRQELTDMYRALRSSQDGLSGSGDELHSRNKAQDGSNIIPAGVNSRSQSSQHSQRQLHRGERIMGSPEVGVDNSVYSSGSQINSVKRHFASMEYMSGIPATGNVSLELLKQIQNQKYLCKSQASSSQDSLKHSRGTGSSSGSATNLNQTCDLSASWTSQHNPRNDISRLKKEESTQTYIPQVGRRTKPVMTKGYTEPPVASPRPTLRHLSGMCSEESLVSRLRPTTAPRQKLTRQMAKDFQEELLRLIDPNLSENDLVGFNSRGQSSHKSGPLQDTLSDDSLHRSEGPRCSKIHVKVNGFASQRLSPRVVMDSTSLGQRKTDSSLQQQFSVRERSGSCDRPHQEERQHSQDDLPPPRPPSPQVKTGLSSSPSSVTTSCVSLTDTSEERIQELEYRLGKMSQELDKVQQRKLVMVAEVRQLRAVNVRLQKESQTAATQLRRFTEWFFNTIYQQ